MAGALDAEVEAEIRAALYDRFLPVYGDRVAGYVEGMLNLDHYRGRFDWLLETVETIPAAPVLVSGFAAGSEMIVARLAGFDPVYGVEVDPFLVTTAASRTHYLGGVFPTWYDGLHLPFADSWFGVVASGHVIEHTADPFAYLCECLRVLKPGGFLALEFPTRFHWIELHTGLPSLEWLPRPIRDGLLHALGSRFSPFSAGVKRGYRSIVRTRLQQISAGKVQRYLKRSGWRCSILRMQKVAPGVIRMAIGKEVAEDGLRVPGSREFR